MSTEPQLKQKTIFENKIITPCTEMMKENQWNKNTAYNSIKDMKYLDINMTGYKNSAHCKLQKITEKN